MACNDRCHTCGESLCENQCICTQPTYTNTGNCDNGLMNSNCIIYVGNDSTCVDVVKPISLTTTIQKILTYIKNTFKRVTSVPTEDNASKVLLTLSDETCEDSLNIQIVPSEDANNQLTVGTDGYPYVGGTVVDCDVITNLFGEEAGVNQGNGLDQADLQFLATGDSGCRLVAPPLGFAVAGANRISLFGKMEWFSTLDAANTSAVSGDSVILFIDSNTTLTPKNGVSYQGIGQRTITSITSTTTYVGSFSNISVTETVSFSGVDSIITTSNFMCNGIFTISNNVIWTGGTFKPVYAGSIINVKYKASLSHITTKTRISITGSGNVSHVKGIDLRAPTNPTSAFVMVNSEIAADSYLNNHPTFTNSNIYSLHNSCIYGYVFETNTGMTISNNTFTSDGPFAMRVDTTKIQDIAVINVSSNNAYCSNGVGLLVSGNVSEDDGNDLPTYKSKNVWSISNCNGTSKTNIGILVYSGNLKNCTGVSYASYGIKLSGELANNTNIIECVGESHLANGLYAETNAYLAGGTYISNLNSSTGSPIYLGATEILGYFIIGVNTIAHHLDAYGIDGAEDAQAAVRGCNFINRYVVWDDSGVLVRKVSNNIIVETDGVRYDVNGNTA